MRSLFHTLPAAAVMAVMLCVPAFLCGCSSSYKTSAGVRLANGDLLFAVSGEANAITLSTVRNGLLATDHVAVFFLDNGRPSVVEATTRRGVSVSPLDSFLSENPLCVAGRVGRASARLSVGNALKFVGLPYDSLFDVSDSAIYCSELVQKSFVDSQGSRLFTTIPMSFHDANGTTLPFWKELYRRHGREVPEGEPGTNPAQIAASPVVKVIGTVSQRKRHHSSSRKAVFQNEK